MNETTKTVSFVVLALAGVGLALATRPSPPTIDSAKDVVGKPLAPEFKDPLAAKSMEIIDYDQDTGQPKRFKVAQTKGVWSLPSHFDYPADAQEQLATAASSLLDLKILQLMGDKPGDYPLYGVVDPTKAEPGAQGVGKRITLADQNDKRLLDIIVGKEVKDAPKLRYVREADKAQVYVVAISTDKLSTRFDSWIEKDLLKLNSWDISRVFINSYSIDVTQGRPVPGDVLDLTYNDKEGKWKLADLKEGEELDTAKLNELKTALDDLKIVDVRRKPAGLSRDLRTEEGITLDEATVLSLNSKGFYPTRNGDLLSNQGEVVAGTTEGVQYVLRFGEVALGTEQAEQEQKSDQSADEKKDEAADEAKKEQGANRYLFLMAQFDQELIPKPELEEVPQSAEQPAETPAQNPQPDPTKVNADQKPAQGPADPETNDTADTQPTPQSSAENQPDKTEPQAKEESKKEDAPASEDKTKTETESKSDSNTKTPEEIERIKADNKRKQDEYNEKVKKGQEKVKQLNDRFADWYYVISNDIYKKIHLTRADIIKQPPAEKQKDSPAEFEQLKEGIDQGTDQLPAAPESK
jgi:hypothetical protein